MTNITTVPFYGKDLIVLENNGQPYVAMKPVAEGMGLAWQSQLAKFNAKASQWGITKIVMPTASNMQEMVCLPLRKLFAWLMTIMPNKVKPEIRNKVIQYQNECDDVIWDYWTKGQVVNPRFRKEETRNVLPNCLTKDQQDAIKQFHRQLVESVPKDKQAKLAITLWSSIKSKYGVSYKEVPKEEFTGIVSLMSRVAIDNEYKNIDRLNNGYAMPDLNSENVDRSSLAFSAASEVSSQVSRVVFDAILKAKDFDLKYRRWIFDFKDDDGKLIPNTRLVQDGAMIISLAELPSKILEPNGIHPSNMELVDIAAACNKRLAKRLEYEQNKKLIA